MRRNHNFSRLTHSYLFAEISRKASEFREKNPSRSLINLSIGDTSLPLMDTVTDALKAKSEAMGTHEGYVGYGPYEGIASLREKIAEVIYQNRVSPDEIFISDGAKCDLGRLQILFGENCRVAMQDPCYPAYLDGSLLCGLKPTYFLNASTPDEFLPSLDEKAPAFDLLFFCSPHNPTGYALSRFELEELVKWVKKRKAILVFDAAYASFIQDPNLPKSIFEIAGADEVAIEVGSFSKRIGFSGVRLGWTVVRRSLKYDDGNSVWQDYMRLHSTLFNGASILSQVGATAALTHEGLQKTEEMIQYYLENARILKQALEVCGYNVSGGKHAPYLWVKFDGKASWALFDEFLLNRGLITTPGEGFGHFGKGALRFSTFGRREKILEAALRLA